MKKIILIVTLLLVTISLSACETTEMEEPDVVVDNGEVLGILSYISTSFLYEKTNEDVAINADFTTIDFNLYDKLVKPETEQEIELDLDQVNIYVDKLKSFIENGTDGFGTIESKDSDNPEYEFMITITVEEDVYVLYYSIDEETNEISGVFINDGNEYMISAENSILYEKEFDEMSEEEKQSLILMARDGQNTIMIEYEIKEEENETKQTFRMISYIEGIVDEFEIEIKVEDMEYVLTITSNGDEFIFKMDDEEDDEDFNYKLDYVVNEIKGKVRVLVKQNEDGDTVYVYRVQEGNVKVYIEMEDPDTVVDPLVEQGNYIG